MGRYMQAVCHIVMVNLTSFTIVITEYSKDATILHRTAQRLCANLQYGEWRQVDRSKMAAAQRAWSGRMGHLYMSMSKYCVNLKDVLILNVSIVCAYFA